MNALFRTKTESCKEWPSRIPSKNSVLLQLRRMSFVRMPTEILSYIWSCQMPFMNSMLAESWGKQLFESFCLTNRLGFAHGQVLSWYLKVASRHGLFLKNCKRLGAQLVLVQKSALSSILRGNSPHLFQKRMLISKILKTEKRPTGFLRVAGIPVRPF